MPISPCKSPTHKRYRDALEGLYIQTALAHRDLTEVMDEARELKDSRQRGASIRMNDRKVRTAEARLAFGRSELDEASRLVDEHLKRCRGA